MNALAIAWQALRDMLKMNLIPRTAWSAAHPLSNGADGIRSALRAATAADESIAQRLPRTLDHIGSRVEAEITRPHSSDDVEDLAALIGRRSAELGLHTRARRALESSLFIDAPVHQLALLSRQTRPELAFGEGEWAGYLDARTTARRYGDQDLTVSFMTELHRRVAQFTMPHLGGVTSPSGRLGIKLGTFTDRELAAIEANPYLGHLPQGTVPLGRDYSAIVYRTRPKAIKGELQALSDWYNNARKLPGTDPHWLAAELQRRYVSIHPWSDYNGRSSRILMNWSLENHGLPPSAPSDFNKDLYSTSEEWTGMVRAGSDSFGERANRLEQLGDTADPIEMMGLERESRVYQDQGYQISVFTPGEHVNIAECQQILAELRDGPR